MNAGHTTPAGHTTDPATETLACSRHFLLVITNLALCMSRIIAWTYPRAAAPLSLASRHLGSLVEKGPFGAAALAVRTRARSRSPVLVLKCYFSKKPMDFRVATYNVLCSHLAESSRFPLCTPNNLDAPTRLKRVKHKLDDEVTLVVN